MAPSAARRSLLVVLTTVLLAAAGCSLPGGGPDADAALRRLATALTVKSLAGVPVVGDRAVAQKDLSDVVGDLGDVATLEVTAGKASTDGDTATGRLRWHWRVDGRDWSYSAPVRLTEGSTADGDAWRLQWSSRVVQPSLEQGERLRTTFRAPTRADVLGQGDRPIVTLRPVVQLGVDKTELDARQAEETARAVAGLVGVDAPALVRQVRAAGPKAFVTAIVYRQDDVPAGVVSAVQRAGGRSVPGQLPLAPTKDFAAALLGSVGPATAELVTASKGRVRAGEDVGVSGLQKRYDDQLAGTPAVTVVAAGAGQERVLFRAGSRPGTPLRTTLDPAAQRVAQQALADVGSASALVAIRPSTGAIVAAASGPGSQGYNTATYGRYAPGSTFKIVSTLALLRAGVTPATPVSCPATTVVDGKTFKNYSDYPPSRLGRIPFVEALANSCNTAFITERGELGRDSLSEAAAALGLGVDHDTGFPAYFGQVGTPAGETQAAAGMIGQGTVLASPMAMATVVASVLKGSTVVPRLLPDVEVDPSAPADPLTAAEAARLRSMMRAVVERGSGALLADVPGGPVIAKTGTAEYGEKAPLPTHAWMVAGQGDLAVAVFVERGESGSQTAGPVLKRFLEQVRVP